MMLFSSLSFQRILDVSQCHKSPRPVSYFIKNHSLSIHFFFIFYNSYYCTFLQHQSARVYLLLLKFALSPFIITLYMYILSLPSDWRFLKSRDENTAHKRYLDILTAYMELNGWMERWMVERMERIWHLHSRYILFFTFIYSLKNLFYKKITDNTSFRCTT